MQPVAADDAADALVGAEVNDQSLTPGGGPRIAQTHFEDWLSHSAPQK